MLDLAHTRMQREGPAAQDALVRGTATHFQPGPFDAATAFHCLMFVPA
jgi:hypothetical protein